MRERGSDLPELMVQVRFFDAFVFRPSVLEPDFDLGLAEVQGGGQFRASGARYVLGRLELDFEAQRLLLGESRALASLAQALRLSSGHCKWSNSSD